MHVKLTLTLVLKILKSKQCATVLDNKTLNVISSAPFISSMVRIHSKEGRNR